MNEVLLTKIESYKAMINFIEHLYRLNNDDSLGGFLGSMQLLNDGMPADPAYWDDWEAAIEKVLTLRDKL